MAFKKEGFHCSLAFDLDLASRFEMEAVAQQRSGRGTIIFMTIFG
jgi:hypothetical protein